MKTITVYLYKRSSVEVQANSDEEAIALAMRKSDKDFANGEWEITTKRELA